MPDPDIGALTALRRLRHAETDSARRDLGAALTRETALATEESALAQELAEARQFSGDFDREAFAAWLGRVRAQRVRLADAIREAASHAETARTMLAHRRVAETTAETALADAVAAQQAMAAQREQVMLEDVARTLKRTLDH
jgi:hypothetical protein